MASITNISVEQIPGLVDPGDLNVPIFKITVITDGNLVIDSFSFSTTGTTVDAYIDSANLYFTGPFDAFSTGYLVGSFTSPTGNYDVSSIATLTLGINYFWLTYDVSSSIVYSNYLDGELNSVSYDSGTVYVPDTTNYSGYIDLNTQWYPMTFVSAEVYQATDPTSTYPYAPVVKIRVTTSGSISPLTCEQFQTSVMGTVDLTEIISARIVSTGTSSVYVSPSVNIFATVFSPSGIYYMNGSLTLEEGDNYFWLLYEIASWADLSHTLDATVDNVVINSAPNTIGTNNPSGALTIAESFDYISYTSSTCEQLTGYVVPGSIVPVLKIKVTTTGTLFYTSGYDIYPWISNLYLGITGSTDAINDISDVIVYGTGADDTFNNAYAFGQLGSSPSGPYTLPLFTGGTPPYGLLSGDNYFWVAYSISPSATLGNVVDATFDSLDFDGVVSGSYVPSISDPSGNVTIVDEMVIDSVNIYTNSNGNSYPGEQDIQLFKVEVDVTGGGYPQKFWSFTFVNDSHDQVLTNKDLVTNIRLYFTGTESTFNDSVMIGTASYDVPVVYNINNVELIGELGNSVTNYFWLVGDVAPNAYYKEGVTPGHVHFTNGTIQFIETSITP